MFPVLAGSNPSGYNLTRSLRFRASASASLNKTFGTPTNNKIWSLSVWVKRGTIGSRNFIASTNTTGGANAFYLDWDSDALEFGEYTGGWAWRLTTTQVFRDPSAWYHIVYAVDTTQATASNRVKLYINGVQVTAFSIASYPTQNLNTYWNQSGQSGRFGELNGASIFYDGYLTEVNFIDGQALTPSSFGSFNALTGVWQPARYTGTYGTNGFYLPFTDNSALTTSSNVGIGKDFSGNGNYWTTNNISITAGATYDSMTDVPTLTSATASNFAVLNPLNPSRSTLTNGNLTASGTTDTPTIMPASGTYYFEISGVSKTWTPPAAFPAAAGNYNFGQQPFTNTPTATLLNCYNLPTSTILQGNKVMDATLYTGNGSTQSITNAGGFKPDLVWVKSRSAATDHKWTDSVRGVTKALISNTSGAETTDTNGLTAFNSNGWSLGTDTAYNNSASTYVGYQWQAGQGTSSSNTSGSITSTVSVNASAGFSVVTYTAQSSGTGTFGHGLGVAPSLVITKPIANPYSWTSYHASLGNTQYIELNTPSAAATNSTVWNNTSPTSSVFTLGSAFAGNGTYVAYCWTPIAGYSAFGSYTGNNSTDGPMVYLGFKPKFLLIKASSTTDDWFIYDSTRNTYNILNLVLFPDLSNAESAGSVTFIDFLSNGFKLRNTGLNGPSVTYIYAAFSTNPFKNSLAF